MFDDMQMGTWFNRLDVNVAHESGFHQAKPDNYVATKRPIEFE